MTHPPWMQLLPETFNWNFVLLEYTSPRLSARAMPLFYELPNKSGQTISVETRERQSPDWRNASRQSGDWRSRAPTRHRNPSKNGAVCSGAEARYNPIS